MDNPVELLFGVLAGAADGRANQIRTAVPGRVTEYNAAKQKAKVQPLVQEAHQDENDERVVKTLPPIPEVPVVFPGGGGFRVTFPIAVGDTVLLVFSQASLDRWLQRGGVVDPGDDRKHDLCDAIAIPGLRDFAHALGSAPTDRATLGKDGGPVVEITGTEIIAGGTDRLVTKADFDGHTHLAGTFSNGGGPVTGVSGVPTSGATGTAQLRGFVHLILALALALTALGFFLGRV